jgi:hypothetical protein
VRQRLYDLDLRLREMDEAVSTVRFCRAFWLLPVACGMPFINDDLTAMRKKVSGSICRFGSSACARRTPALDAGLAQ